MSIFRVHHLFQNEFHTAGDILLDAAAERREGEAAQFHQEMDAYVAETNALLAAGRPLSERKLAPPTFNPYETTLMDHAGQSFKSFGSFFTKFAVVVLISAGLFIAMVLGALLN